MSGKDMFEFLMINLTLQLRDEQHSIFYKIMEAINNRRGGAFFYMVIEELVKLSCGELYQVHCVRRKKIVLIIASSRIASLLLSGGGTTHSKFKILVSTLNNSTCNIGKDTGHSQLLEATYLIKPLKISLDVMVLRIQYLVAK